MKLLFDQNLSFKLCAVLADLLPDSSQVRLLGLPNDSVTYCRRRGQNFVRFRIPALALV
jgi:hypothetical protein